MKSHPPLEEVTLTFPNTLDEFNHVMGECQTIFFKKMEDYGASWRAMGMDTLPAMIYIKIKKPAK